MTCICVWLLNVCFFVSCTHWYDVDALHCIMLQLHGMAHEDERRRTCAAGLYPPPVYCSASGSQEESHLAWELQNPNGISVASHRFVSMAFDCPTWMGFYALWFPWVGSCGLLWADFCFHYCVCHSGKDCWKPEHKWQQQCRFFFFFFFFFPNRKLHFSRFYLTKATWQYLLLNLCWIQSVSTSIIYI